jgi:hypothetical protein
MSNEFHHPMLAAGRWFTFSLAEQLGHVGSEISRALKAQGQDEKRFENAVFRGLELMDLTISDPRWKRRLKELVRVRALISDAYFGGTEFGTKLEDLNKYFYYFAYAAQKQRLEAREPQ